MNFYAWTGLVNTVTTVLAGFFVFSRHQGDARRLTFAFFAVSVAWWSFFYFCWQLATTEQSALLLLRLLVAGGFFIPATFFHHVLTLLDIPRQGRYGRLVQWNYGIACGLLVGDITPLVVPAVAPRLSFPFWPTAGPLWTFYMVWFFTTVIYALTLLYQGYVGTTGAIRAQRGYLFVATLVAFAGGSTNFFLWYNIPIPPFGNVVVPFYTILAALAAIRYRLMDIKVAITRTGLLLGTYLIVLGGPFIVGWWGRAWLQQRLGEHWWLVPLGLCTALATAGPFAYAYLRRQAEEKLLSHQRRYQRTLQSAARGMTQVRDVVRLCKLMTRFVSKTVGVTHASVFVWDKVQQRYVLRASHGPQRLALQSRYGLEASHPLIQRLLQRRRVLTEDEWAHESEPSVAQEMANLGAVLAIPGLIEQRMVGMLVLGPKVSGADYSPDDLHAFATLANEAAMAIENALSYEELIRVNEQLQVASQRLLAQERLAAAGQFAAGMAHEIKNPLSAIKTFAQYLPEKYEDPAFREKFSRIVQGEIDRINTIIKELLDFAKPAAPQLQPVRVSELVDDTLSLLSNQCLKQGVEVRRALGANGVLVHADPQQIKQVLLNLLLNSLEAMPAGGRLEVATSTAPDALILRVTDSGQGISPEHVQQIWDPFFTTKERGMGLGLAIVKGVVERHGGQISISSRPGQGTTVELHLSLASVLGPGVVPVPPRPSSGSR